ncbi:hypothetical protein ABZ345_29200 [Lentzea sp. NPDC005914]|uniref:hypothetical protein n=1 Tax=Lentzea sp. NPDC005914 TaxID=3154572 RepID=UPI0033DB6C72
MISSFFASNSNETTGALTMSGHHDNAPQRTPIVPAAPEHDVHDVLQGTITWDQYHASRAA